MLKIDKQMIDEIVAETINAIKDFEHDSDNFPLFEITRDDNGLITDLMINDRIMAFFVLLLRCNQYENSLVEPLSTIDNDYEEFLDYFLSDIKMCMLKDALINLVSFFESNKSDMKYPEIEQELFYDFTSFAEQIEQYISLTNFSDPDGVMNAIYEHQDVIHLKVPKLCFPWFAFALCHTYIDFPSWVSQKKFNIINGRYLPLKWTRSKYPNEREIIEKAQKNFQVFIKSLEHQNDPQSKGTYNRSLNLYLFNETTNLYDLYNIVSLFREGSTYMRYQNFRMDNGIKTTEDGNVDLRYHWKQSIFEGVSQIAEINTLGVKTLLIDDYYSKKLFTSEGVWDTFNKIVIYCKSFLLDSLKQQRLSEYEHVADEIRLDYCVYSELNKEEPYEGFLQDALEGGLPIYVPSEKEVETHLYEAYSYAYKNFYKGRYKGNKSEHLEKY